MQQANNLSMIQGLCYRGICGFNPKIGTILLACLFVFVITFLVKSAPIGILCPQKIPYLSELRRVGILASTNQLCQSNQNQHPAAYRSGLSGWNCKKYPSAIWSTDKVLAARDLQMGDCFGQFRRFSTIHRVAFCQFLFQWIYYYGNNKSTGKETGFGRQS